MINTLINRDTIDGVSSTFVVHSQVTVYAMGLQEGDKVELYMCLTSAAQKARCACPPFNVTLPEVVDEIQLTCCGVPIELSIEKPYVIIDNPLMIPLRVKLIQSDENEPIVSQLVWFEETTTANVNDRLRGCPCDSP